MQIPFLMAVLGMLTGSVQPSEHSKIEGFFDLHWHAESGQLWLAIDTFDEPFLMIHGLATGVGSNDLGLDRGQIGDQQVVHFERVGNRVFLVKPNLRYRAHTENEQEVQAVRESFSPATLWSAEIAEEVDGRVLVDIGSLVMSDLNQISRRLASQNEGSFSLDRDRSRYYQPHIKSFPDNTELEATLTFAGKPSGPHLPTVASEASAFTFRQHLSFVRLPDTQYKPRAFHPRSGGFFLEYFNYAAPLDKDLKRMFLIRHRLVRKNPNAARSELVKPLVYYVDSGAPAAIRDALIEGASWWKQAFEAAGIINGFEVKVLPANADPMDVRYNVIQWVHRSTRGWSYGMPVHDPRTGEIIKGHVTLGSLRVRQDRLIFEAMLPPEERGENGWDPLELALARIRQLSAHEVGHTLGFAHNFAASASNRASVMDYPAPYITLNNGRLDASQAYDVGIGDWDKLACRYLYGSWADEDAGLARVLADAEKAGIAYITDRDARLPGSMHPYGNLWDNGSEPLAEYERLVKLRRFLLDRYGPRFLEEGKALSRLEEGLVPIYLFHRYQLDALVKLIGGGTYRYAANNESSDWRAVAPEQQRLAFQQILASLQPEFLLMPKQLDALIPPPSLGWSPDREYGNRKTSPAFDREALPMASINLTLKALLQTERLNRLVQQNAMDSKHLSVRDIQSQLQNIVLANDKQDPRQRLIQNLVRHGIVEALISAVGQPNLHPLAKSEVLITLNTVKNPDWNVNAAKNGNPIFTWLTYRIERFLEAPQQTLKPSLHKVPPGSPIGHDFQFGCGHRPMTNGFH